MQQGVTFSARLMTTAAFGAAIGLLALAGQPALARQDALPAQTAAPAAPAAPTAQATQPASGAAVDAQGKPAASAVIVPEPVVEPELEWSLGNARALLGVIEQIGAEGLIPADYQPEALRKAIAAGEGDTLNQVASKAFAWVAEDLRDGRTPVPARVQWFAVDPDQDVMPTRGLMEQALAANDVAGVLAGLAPTHPDYALLKSALGATPPSAKARRAMIQANMDRWRWLARDLGDAYLLTNVPEFQLRLTVNNDRVGYKIIRTYRTVVGKPGRTATPQLAELVKNVVFNPTWTVPQSIVKGEGLGAQLLANPARAKRENYKVTKGANGYISVVQQPGPGNALGLMKIDMPNEHAIYLHDTPSKQYFNHPVRAYSHGCIRTERAVELGMTMAMLGADMAPEQAAAISRSGVYTKVPMTRTFPVYITYFTFGRDIDGTLRAFNDIYGRDKPVLDSFASPRQAKTTQRISNEAVIKLDNPL